MFSQFLLGKYCEIQDKKQCTSDYCHNNGQCISTGSDLSCKCSPGFDGAFCELKAEVTPIFSLLIACVFS
ncbi:hypothetical protein FGF82_23935, partial [Salmonella sp. gx-f9]|nr:hypothetical protein [Salmonella sp. gx-f9]